MFISLNQEQYKTTYLGVIIVTIALWGLQGKLCCRLLSESIPGYSILIPILFCWFNFLDKKAQKNYIKEDSNR